MRTKTQSKEVIEDEGKGGGGAAGRKKAKGRRGGGGHVQTESRKRLIRISFKLQDPVNDATCRPEKTT